MTNPPVPLNLPEIFFKFKKQTQICDLLPFNVLLLLLIFSYIVFNRSLESYITNHEKNIKANETIVGLVFPVYIWDMPKMVVNFLEKLTKFIREIYV